MRWTTGEEALERSKMLGDRSQWGLPLQLPNSPGALPERMSGGLVNAEWFSVPVAFGSEHRNQPENVLIV